jgi:hypothetical protein
VQRVGAALAWLAPFVLLALVLAGAYVIAREVDTVWILAVVAPLVFVLAVRLLAGPQPHLILRIALLVGALIIPVYALVGFDWVWAKLPLGTFEPGPGIVVGALVVAFAALTYLAPWWVPVLTARRKWWTAGIVALMIVALPFLLFACTGKKGSVPGEQVAAVSQLEVVVLAPDDADVEPGARDAVRGWSIKTWIGRLRPTGVEWDGAAPPLMAGENADRVLVLMPPAEDDPGRWIARADEVTAVSTPTYAILSGEATVGAWTDALRPAAGRLRTGEAFSTAELVPPGERPSAAQLAVKLVGLAPTSDEDLSLAAHHRPAIFFDSDEPYARPLDVDDALESGTIRLCSGGEALRALCDDVESSADLHNGASHLAFDPDDLAEDEEIDTTIYVSITRSGNDHGNAIYLDYWWYFPHNPTGAGDGALCGAGLMIAGVTCFDHHSDWEGVTVVLDEDAPERRPTAVHYAQHDHVTRYPWKVLQHRWAQGDRERFGQGIDTSGAAAGLRLPRAARLLPVQLLAREVRRRGHRAAREPAQRRPAVGGQHGRRLPGAVPGRAPGAT